MPRTGTLLETAISFYGNLGLNIVKQMRETQEDLRTDNFDLGKTIGRGLSLWLDAVDGGFSALLVTASDTLPTIFLQIGPATSTITQTAHVLVPGDQELAFTGLLPIGETDEERKTFHDVTITSKPTDQLIEVKIKDMNNKRPAPGFYQGLIYVGQRPVAIVMAQVERAASQSGPESREGKQNSRRANAAKVSRHRG